jgi:alcohol dehydrogenase class IV
MPKSLTSTSGMDALTHAIESYITPVANPFSDAMAISSFIYGYKNLLTCYLDGSNIEARSNMLAASCMGGIAFSNSALGSTHSVAHAFGAELGVPHGLANAVTLSYDIEFNSDHLETVKRYDDLARFINVPSLFEAIIKLTKDLEVPHRMKDVIKDDVLFEASLETLVEKAMADVCTRTSPKQPTVDQMRTLIKTVYYGR